MAELSIIRKSEARLDFIIPKQTLDSNLDRAVFVIKRYLSDDASLLRMETRSSSRLPNGDHAVSFPIFTDTLAAIPAGTYEFAVKGFFANGAAVSPPGLRGMITVEPEGV